MVVAPECTWVEVDVTVFAVCVAEASFPEDVVADGGVLMEPVGLVGLVKCEDPVCTAPVRESTDAGLCDE